MTFLVRIVGLHTRLLRPTKCDSKHGPTVVGGLSDAQANWALSNVFLASEQCRGDRQKWTETSFDFGRLACRTAKNLENENFSSSKYTTKL